MKKALNYIVKINENFAFFLIVVFSFAFMLAPFNPFTLISKQDFIEKNLYVGFFYSECIFSIFGILALVHCFAYSHKWNRKILIIPNIIALILLQYLFYKCPLFFEAIVRYIYVDICLLLLIILSFMKIKHIRNVSYLMLLVISFICIQYIPEQEMKHSILLCQENNNCEKIIKTVKTHEY